MDNRLQRHLVFIGAPGSGKTTIGKMVADQLGLPFYDVDRCIEEQEGMTIGHMFKQGEDFFRRAETKALGAVMQQPPGIVATGGGVVKKEENMDVAREKGLIVFLNRPLEDIVGDIDFATRPLLTGDGQAIYRLYQERYPLYKQYCDVEVYNVGKIGQVVNSIVQLLLKRLG